MKFTLGWLKQHLETQATLEEIGAALTATGLEVEGVENPAQTYEAFKVAYVEKAEPHPDADRLRVCIVDTGNEKLQVVCGAPNARTGMKGVFAPEGSYIPGTDMVLKKGTIRGQDSCGMLVSEREMGLSDEHEGIIEVAEDIAVGTPFAALYGMDDPVIEIGLTPNRPDCAGVRGIARDLAAAGLGTLKPLDESPVSGAFASPVKISIKDQDACPLFIGRYIKGVKNGPSPDWLQNRLKAIGLRPISALVDITNYLSYDLCRPLHVFDAAKLKGDIEVRLSQGGEQLAALNEKTYTLGEGMTVVCDDRGVLALGGVIGGEETGCTEATTDVFLEVAYFDPARTARTGRALQITSDARYRFERGIDPAFTVPATEIATRLILELCGGEASEVVTAGTVPDWQRSIEFDPAYTAQLAGVEITAARQKEILETLGFAVEGSGPFKVMPPSWRGDIEGRADLVEEVARINGYDKIEPLSLPKLTAVTENAETPSLTKARQARSILAARGMKECVTWSFMPAALADKFGAQRTQNAAALHLLNPISADLDQMRPTPLGNLAEAARRNIDKGFPNNALFEVGPAFISAAPDGQMTIAAGLRDSETGPRHWSSRETDRPVDAYDAKADALAVIAACGGPADNLQVTRDAPEWYHPGRAGALRLGPNIIAVFGELHPALREELGLKGAAAGFEVYLDNIPQPKQKSGTAKKLLKLASLQPVSRDFAFIVDDTVEADSIIRAARGAEKNLIAAVDVFDIYKGKGVEDGKKSIAINVTLQPTEQTLTDDALEDIAGKIVSNVIAKTGGQLRG